MPVSPNLIADAVVTAIRGLGLVDSDKVQKLKTPSLPSGVSPPFIAVCVGEMGAEGQTEALAWNKKLNSYPTVVAIITANGRSLADDETVREWRDAIEDAIDDRARTTFASVAGFNKVDTTGQAPFDGSLISRDLNFSSQTFRVEVIETRAT